MKNVTIVKVSSNDEVPLIYLGKAIQKFWKVKKGDFLSVSLDASANRLILEHIKLPVHGRDGFRKNHFLISSRGRED